MGYQLGINRVSTGYHGVSRGIMGYHGYHGGSRGINWGSTGDQQLLRIYFYQTCHVQLHPFDQRGTNGVSTGYQRSIMGYHGVSRGITGYHGVSWGITGDQRGIKGGSKGDQRLLRIYFYLTRHVQLHPFDIAVNRYHGGSTGDQRGINGFYGYNFIKHIRFYPTHYWGLTKVES